MSDPMGRIDSLLADLARIIGPPDVYPPIPRTRLDARPETVEDRIAMYGRQARAMADARLAAARPRPVERHRRPWVAILLALLIGCAIGAFAVKALANGAAAAMQAEDWRP